VLYKEPLLIVEKDLYLEFIQKNPKPTTYWFELPKTHLLYGKDGVNLSDPNVTNELKQYMQLLVYGTFVYKKVNHHCSTYMQEKTWNIWFFKNILLRLVHPDKAPGQGSLVSTRLTQNINEFLGGCENRSDEETCKLGEKWKKEYFVALEAIKKEITTWQNLWTNKKESYLKENKLKPVDVDLTMEEDEIIDLTVEEEIIVTLEDSDEEDSRSMHGDQSNNENSDVDQGSFDQSYDGITEEDADDEIDLNEEDSRSMHGDQSNNENSDVSFDQRYDGNTADDADDGIELNAEDSRSMHGDQTNNENRDVDQGSFDVLARDEEPFNFFPLFRHQGHNVDDEQSYKLYCPACNNKFKNELNCTVIRGIPPGLAPGLAKQIRSKIGTHINQYNCRPWLVNIYKRDNNAKDYEMVKCFLLANRISDCPLTLQKAGNMSGLVKWTTDFFKLLIDIKNTKYYTALYNTTNVTGISNEVLDRVKKPTMENEDTNNSVYEPITNLSSLYYIVEEDFFDLKKSLLNVYQNQEFKRNWIEKRTKSRFVNDINALFSNQLDKKSTQVFPNVLTLINDGFPLHGYVST